MFRAKDWGQFNRLCEIGFAAGCVDSTPSIFKRWTFSADREVWLMVTMPNYYQLDGKKTSLY